MELDLQHIHAGQSSTYLVIKYAVTLGYRYNSCNLLELRIHDINVVADPSTGVPPEGMYYDGTYTEINLKSRATIEEYGTMGAAELETGWSGPWPLLHMTCQYVISAFFSITFHSTIDLLGSFNVADFYLGIEDNPDLPTPEIVEAAQEAVALFLTLSRNEALKMWSLIMGIAWGTMGLIAAASNVAFWLEVVFLSLLAAWWVAFVNALALTVEMILSGDWTPLAGALALAILGGGLILGTAAAWVRGGSAAWQETWYYFDEAMIHPDPGAEDVALEAFKGRLALYLTLAQFAALIVLALTAFGLYSGAFG